jgi:hypothetical protein
MVVLPSPVLNNLVDPEKVVFQDRLSTDCRYSTGSTERRRNWRASTASSARKRGRVTGRISNLNGSECPPRGRGSLDGIRSKAKFPTAGHRPTPKIHIPVSIPNERWQPRYQRSTECFAGAARPTGLRTNGTEWLNHPTSTSCDCC